MTDGLVLPVSLVIPTRNRPDQLAAAVASVLAGEALPAQIVVADQSDGRAATLPEHPLVDICHLRLRSVGLSRGRNEGMAACTQPVLAFLDDDMTVEARWLAELHAAALAVGERGLVTGRVVPVPTARGHVPSCSSWTEAAVFAGRQSADPLQPCNMAAHRSLFERVGDFDPRLGAGARYPSAEDNDYGHRLLDAGFEIHLVPGAVSIHHGVRAGRDLLALDWAYGRGQGAFYAKHASRRDPHTLRRLGRNARFRLRSMARAWRGDPVAVRDAVYLVGMLVGFASWRLTHGSDPVSIDHRDRGAGAMRRYRADPPTLATSGLTGYRETPVVDLQVRRLLMRVPALAGFLSRRRGRAGALGADALWWRGVRDAATPSEWRALTGAVAILMYHGFGDREPASRYVLPVRELDRHLRLLRVLRRRVVPLDDYVRARHDHELVDPRTTVLTIDDGYRDTYDLAVPVLRRHGATATIFVPSDRVGGDNDWTPDGPLARRPIADAAELRAGLDVVAVGSHARTHPALSEIAPEAAVEEIAGSRTALGELLGREVTTFAYPYGDEDDHSRAAVLSSGYRAACSSRGGKNLPGERLDSLRRVEVRGTDPLWRFALAVVLGSARPVRAFRAGFDDGRPAS